MTYLENMNCGREEGATDKFSRKKRKQVKGAEKCSRSNLKSGSTNSLGEKLQRSAGPGIQIHLLRSKQPLPDDSHWKAFSGDIICSGRRMRVNTQRRKQGTWIYRIYSPDLWHCTRLWSSTCTSSHDVMQVTRAHVIQGSSTFYRSRTPATVQNIPQARYSATVLEEREHQIADGQNMIPNPALILGLCASSALLRWGKFKEGR